MFCDIASYAQITEIWTVCLDRFGAIADIYSMHKPKKTNTLIWSYHYALKEQMWPVSRAQIDIVVFVLEKPTRYLHRHLSVKSTYLNCCLTQAVTLPLAIPPPPCPDSPAHDSPRRQAIQHVSKRATRTKQETCDSQIRRLAPWLLTHLWKTEWSGKFVWEAFWQSPAALSVQHML